MGVVFRAHDDQLDRDVALKLLPAAAFDDPAARARLLREARTASRLNHPHICTIHEVGEAEGQAYLAMELVRGETLRSRLARGALPPTEVLRLGRQFADALAHAHADSVVHRDLKSANIVLTPEGRTKILDFGLAKRVVGEAGAEGATAASTTSTQPGMVSGTLAYMAPEQLRGQPADARSDVWALGVVLHEMATGRLPFAGDTGFEISGAILHEPPEPLPATVPAGLREAVARCLEKDPARRYADGGALAAALAAAEAGGATEGGQREVQARGRRTGVAGVAGAGLLAAVMLFALDAGGVRTRWFGRGGGGGAPPRAVKLAVLPFANLTGDPEQEYLSDGVTQEMIAQLGRLHPQSLSVIARTSVMRYKKAETPVDQIGRELGVDYVLEGSARREASRVRISAELIQVRDQTQLWADVYERDMAGILALQSEVAQKVAGALALKLLPAEQERLARSRPVDPEVYDLCLKGSYYSTRLTRADLDAAERHFNLALEKNPAYAPAYVGIATVWGSRNQMGIVPPREAGPKAKVAALKAVELDDTLASAHHILGGVLAWIDWDWAGAEREYKRSIDLDPNDPASRAGYSHVLMILRRPNEAMQQIDRAMELDPLSVITLSFYAIDLVCARRYDDAIAQARTALRMQPDAPVATTALILSLHEKKQYDDVIATAASVYGGSLFGYPDVAEALNRGYAELGYVGAWRRASDAEAANHGTEPGVAFDVAGNLVMAGEKAGALDWLEKALEQRDPNLPYLSCWPLWDPLRSEPRFQAVLRRIGLPPS